MLYAYDKIEKETGGQKTFKGTGGWVGFTDKYWAATVAPDQSKHFDARLSGGGATQKAYQADALSEFQPSLKYDVIAVTGAVTRVPEHFRDWLAPGGRLFVVHGIEPVMNATLITRMGEEQFTEQNLFETVIDYLDGAAPTPRFDL